MEDHPNLSPEINAAIRKSEADGGIWMKDVKPGIRVLVRTKSRVYTIGRLEDGTVHISGHPEYCPRPVEAKIHGSTWGSPMIKVGWIGRGMHLEFSTIDHRGAITTSTIQDVILEPVQ
jgi:hypothetical protein